ncbi:hypothetical protein HN51_069400 [Arachis hypogaea]|uniref:Germin-like protein n=2 Tax=Arachis hypogaea TaxID=3818 RepID=A0A444Z6A7_ARAHY|nr:germin-like protein subfamily 1 member 1 [Arachis hypogaea]QHO11660.1 Germin-like protein subfamily 1 member [Arachis hypogaea]RYR09706.1 hypothetical protein Ahy_B05g078091 isoform A [Arachis hypogaea]
MMISKMRTNFHSLPLLLFALYLLWGKCRSDPDPLQDYCVANNKNNFFINGVPCINPKEVSASDFATSALSKPGNTSNTFGFAVTPTNTVNLPGLNTLGLVLVRVDIEADGVIPPHSHPRASEVTTCLKGQLLVGFIDTSSRVFTQNLRPGESFVFPKGLIHFLYNRDSKEPVLALSGLNSQNPGAQVASVATFASKPPILNAILAKAFQISAQEVEIIRQKLEG